MQFLLSVFFILNIGFRVSNLGIESPKYARQVITVDFDNDQDPDILITSREPDGSRVYENLGDNNFIDVTDVTGIDFNSPTQKIVVFDLNGDGLKDVILIEPSLGSIPIAYRNIGDFYFERVDAFPPNLFVTLLSFLDADGDGTIDAIAGRTIDGKTLLYLLKQTSPFEFEIVDSFKISGNASTVLIHDLNRDCLPDIVPLGDGIGSILVNMGSGFFVLRAFENFENLRLKKLIPMYSEETEQLAALLQDGGVLLYDSSGTNLSSLIDISDAREMLSCDVDLNGYMDLLVIREFHSPALFLFDKEGLKDKIEIEINDNIFDASIADINNDGRYDFIFSGDNGPHILFQADSLMGGRKVYIGGTSDINGRLRLFRGDTLFIYPLVTDLIPGITYDSLIVEWSDGRRELFEPPQEGFISLTKGEGRELLQSYTYLRHERDTVLILYPNPTKGVLSIHYLVERESQVEVRILNYSGQTIALLESVSRPAGRYSLEWEAEKPGTYIVRVKIGEKVYTRKVVVLK